MKRCLVFCLVLVLATAFAFPAFAAEEEFVIACVGDSVTEGMQTTGGLKGPDAFPAVLEGLLKDSGVGNFVVKNFGKSATTAQKSGDVPYKESMEYRDSLKSNPDVVLIGLGANDSKVANWDADRYEVDYQTLIMEYVKLESKPTVYLINTTYVADQAKTGCQRNTIQNKILPIQKTIAEDLELKIIDLNTLTKKNADKYADGVHPNDELQSMMAEYIFNALCSEGVNGLTADHASAKVTMLDPAGAKAPATDTKTDADTGKTTDSVISSKPVASSDAPIATDETPAPAAGYGWVIWLCVGVVVVAIAAVAVILLLRKKK